MAFRTHTARRRIGQAAVIVLALLASALLPVLVINASANGHDYIRACGQFWPSMVDYEPEPTHSGDTYTAVFTFALTPDEVAALACVDPHRQPHVQIDLHVSGIVVPDGWSGWSIATEGSLPDQLHEVNMTSSGFVASVSGIEVYTLNAWRYYTVTLTFTDVYHRDGHPPIISFEWVPSSWEREEYGDRCDTRIEYLGDMICRKEITRVNLNELVFAED